MFARYIVLQRDDTVRLLGEVFEDERFPDGHWILTSAVTAQGKYIYVTETPTVYNVRKELSLTEFLEEVLMKEKFPTEGLDYCIQLAHILENSMDENAELQKFLKRLSELKKYNPNDW